MRPKTPHLFLTATVASAAALFLAGCDVEQTEEGRMPEVDIDYREGELPEYDVDTADIDLKTKETEVTVPKVDVYTEEETVTVPDVDITMPDAGEPEATE